MELDIVSAVKSAQKGERIRRKSWTKEIHVSFIQPIVLRPQKCIWSFFKSELVFGGTGFAEYRPSPFDIMAKDWEVVKVRKLEPPKK